MEFCAGGDLQDKVNQAHGDHGYRLPKQAMTWLGQIFLGLEPGFHILITSKFARRSLFV